MSYLKSVYISLLLTAAVVGLAVSISRMVTEGLGSPWLGTAVACGAFVTFIGFAYLLPRPRTSRNLYGMLIAGMLGALLAGWLERGFGPATMTASAVGVLGNLIYVFWYSRFSVHNGELAEGRVLPPMRFLEHGNPILSKELIRRPALWIFYRGNWCPLCVAQVREVADQYTELARRGVDVFLVSPQSPKKTEALAKRFNAPMRFLVDPSNQAAAALGIVVRGGLPAGFQILGFGSDVPRPTVFITAAGGQVLWCDVAENYRVRPEPASLFHVLDQHAIH